MVSACCTLSGRVLSGDCFDDKRSNRRYKPENHGLKLSWGRGFTFEVRSRDPSRECLDIDLDPHVVKA